MVYEHIVVKSLSNINTTGGNSGGGGGLVWSLCPDYISIQHRVSNQRVHQHCLYMVSACSPTFNHTLSLLAIIIGYISYLRKMLVVVLPRICL